MHPHAGDIILYPVTPRSSFYSKIISIGEMLWGAGKGLESYSHAAIISEREGWQYEARWPKTGHFRIDHNRIHEVWRIIGITERQREKIIFWCQDHQGEWYNLLALFFGLIQLKNTVICSQFVGEAYGHAGIIIGKEGKRILSPNAIADLKTAQLIYRYKPIY